MLAAQALRSYPASDANQGVAVGGRFFYAVNNRAITKHGRGTGARLLRFVGTRGGPIEHLNSGAVVDGMLYAAHSSYPTWPMESSIEIFDTRTMRHVGTHAFGVSRGSLTWLDRHDGAWWAAFAGYDRVLPGRTEPDGRTSDTRVVKMTDDFRVVRSWAIPRAILDRFEPMSNSGGSWGPDGRLWLAGHDRPEAYVMGVPPRGGELDWVATVRLPGMQGQGIAWDDAGSRPTLWAIGRSDATVIQFQVPDIGCSGRKLPQALGIG